MVENGNIYLRARKSAQKYNDKLCSREGAAELLGIAVSTLADYELGNTKVVPVDKVILMADLYNSPELRNQYCKGECPIGKDLALATQQRNVEGIALRLLQELDENRLDGIKRDLIDIAEDGIISDDEKPKLKEILKKLDRMSEVISELRIAGEKIMRGDGDGKDSR